jgi:hypothetical protein
MNPLAVGLVGLLLMGLTDGIETMFSPLLPEAFLMKIWWFMSEATPPQTGGPGAGCARAGLVKNAAVPATTAAIKSA